MYKSLIVGMSVLLIGLAGFFLQKGGLGGLLVNGAHENGESLSEGSSAAEVFSGIYECNQKSGCKNLSHLFLNDTKMLNLNATINGQNVTLGEGHWDVRKDGSMVLVFQKTDETFGGVPRSIIAKKISILKIKGFSNNKALFDGMSNPTFVRVNNVDTIAQPAASQTAPSIQKDRGDEALPGEKI